MFIQLLLNLVSSEGLQSVKFCLNSPYFVFNNFDIKNKISVTKIEIHNTLSIKRLQTPLNFGITPKIESIETKFRIYKYNFLSHTCAKFLFD